MSYLHCPRCQRAYNVAVQTACPTCFADPTDEVAAAAEQLAVAMDRATPAQIAAAEAKCERGGAILRALRPVAPDPVGSQAILATLAIALLTRLAPPRRALTAWSSRARGLLARF